MDNEIERVSDEELLKNLINGYLNNHYQISFISVAPNVTADEFAKSKNSYLSYISSVM